MSDLIHCPACNHRLPPSEFSGGRCPNCGAMLDALDSTTHFAETKVLDDPARTQLKGESQSTPGELDHLVGSLLHVYQCEALLGRGGMGHVFVARHQDLDRRCALKILSPKGAKKEADYVRRFQQEGRAAASLVHPHVTTVHAIGESDNLHYLEMEFMAGGTLQQLIQREGRLNPMHATQLTAQVCAGLAAAHCQQIVHRDLKPDNILLTADHLPKIADFGLAKRVAANAKSRGSMAGTPNFMAPELFAGAEASLAADIYALGATFFALLSGGVPFASHSLQELMRAVREDPLPELQSLGVTAPASLSDCVDRLLAKQPGDRPRNAQEAVSLLNQVLEDLRDLPLLLDEALGDQPQVQWHCEGEQFLLMVQLPNNRCQQVVVQRSDASREQCLLLIYSICCEANPQHYEFALRLNSEMAHGGLAIREFDGQAMFCVVDTYPWATVDPDEIRLSALEVAQHADAVELRLARRDEH